MGGFFPLDSHPVVYLTLFRIGLFGAAHGCGKGGPKNCHTYPTMMNLGTVIPYLKKIPKNMNHVRHRLSPAEISNF